MAQFKEIYKIEDWKKAFESSSDRPLIIFKHSTICPVSANAFNEFQKYLQSNASPNRITL